MKNKVHSILKRVSQLVLFLAFLSAFGTVVVHVYHGGQRLGRLTPAFWEFVTFPKTVVEAWKELNSPAETKAGLTLVNKLEKDLYAINAHYREKESQWMIVLSNLKTDSVLHRWFLSKDDYHNTGREFSNAKPRNSILLKDWSVLVKLDDSQNLYRISRGSEVLWHNKDYIYHHTMNLGPEGDLWVCSGRNTHLASRYSDRPRRAYFDNGVAHINIETGKVMRHISISDILIDNDYLGLAFGMASGSLPADGKDPFHLNDVEPALKTTEYWQRGDLFLSLRNRSSIIQYRPSTHKVIRIVQGNFLSQHDVDFYSDSAIALYNNNMPNLPTTAAGTVANEQEKPKIVLGSSEVVMYNMRDSSFQLLAKERFEEEEIFSQIEGAYTFLEDGSLFVEDSQGGLIYLFDKGETILKKYTSPPQDSLAETPYWIRIYEDLGFLE